MLVGDFGQRMEAGTFAASQNNALHGDSLRETIPS
jgi:hypothetical protein